MIDDGRLIAERAANEDVVVQFSEYKGYPHIFPFLLPQSPTSKHLFQSWANFCTQCLYKPQSIIPFNKRLVIGTTGCSETDLEKYSDLNFDVMVEKMEAEKRSRKVWVGRTRPNATL